MVKQDVNYMVDPLALTDRYWYPDRHVQHPGWCGSMHDYRSQDLGFADGTLPTLTDYAQPSWPDA